MLTGWPVFVYVRESSESYVGRMARLRVCACSVCGSTARSITSLHCKDYVLAELETDRYYSLTKHFVYTPRLADQGKHVSLLALTCVRPSIRLLLCSLLPTRSLPLFLNSVFHRPRARHIVSPHHLTSRSLTSVRKGKDEG